MKKWKIIRVITIIVLVLYFVRIIADLVACLRMSYPHPMLGIDANYWYDQFWVDMIFFGIYGGIPLIIDIVLLIISCKKLKEK